MPSLPTSQESPSAQKSRSGLVRIWHASRYSLHGLRADWRQAAFRLEAMLALPLLAAAWWLGRGWVEVGMLAGSVLLVLIVELLNSGVESAIDRIGPEWHALSKQAKDMGSAAVLLSLLLCGGLWIGALVARFA